MCYVYLATECDSISVLELTDDSTIDYPLQSLGGPVERVSVPGLLSVLDVVLDHAIVRSSVTLAEEVGLDLVVNATEELPVDFVKIITLKDDGADDTLARRGLHGDVDTAEEEVEVALDGRRLALLRDAELRALVVVGDGGVSRLGPAGVGLRVSREVGREAGRVKGDILGTGLLHRVARSGSLSVGGGECGEDGRGQRLSEAHGDDKVECVCLMIRCGGVLQGVTARRK
jgi:hypothetical protein